jgi:hypothetical protein
MWRYIFNNMQVKVAITLDAKDDDDAQRVLKEKIKTAAEMGIDLPSADTFQPVTKWAL